MTKRDSDLEKRVFDWFQESKITEGCPENILNNKLRAQKCEIILKNKGELKKQNKILLKKRNSRFNILLGKLSIKT